MAASRESSPGGDEALEELCQRYWPPLYAYARRNGYSVEQAQDLTQAFFARFLEKRAVRAADPARGKFRSFLLTSFKHFVANERDRERAQKRGGGQIPVSLEFEREEARYTAEPREMLTPEALFERQWALGVIDRARTMLAAESARAGKGAAFERLKGYLVGEKEPGGYAEIARSLGVSEGAIKVTVHRLRRRFREFLRAEIAATVSQDSEVDAELKYLMAVLSA